MEKRVLLPDIDAVKNFVTASEASNETVLVSKEGFRYVIDGASLLGMMNVVGARLCVSYHGHSDKIIDMLEKYCVKE